MSLTLRNSGQLLPSKPDKRLAERRKRENEEETNIKESDYDICDST